MWALFPCDWQIPFCDTFQTLNDSVMLVYLYQLWRCDQIANSVLVLNRLHFQPQLQVCWCRLCSTPKLKENCRCHLDTNKPLVRSVSIISFIFTYFFTHVFQCPFPAVTLRSTWKVQSILQGSSRYFFCQSFYSTYFILRDMQVSSYLWSRIFHVSHNMVSSTVI